ncbi:MAG: hypothetical protein MRZ79_18525 [Bacteroidia bacterium]|nr:hypothetical protein [Bacteroidia bacterium]
MDFFVNQMLNLSLLAIPLDILEYLYFGIFIMCAAAVYYVLVQRVGDEMPRNTVDKLFFLILGVASLIWVLSKVATPVA